MIGIFDSGSGGLSVLDAIRERAPEADMVYFGDIRNAPYGPKSHDELAVLVREGIQMLEKHGAHEIVSACNSVSQTFLVGASEGARIIEMSRPTARMMRSHAGARVLLLATEATIASGLYRDALWSIVELDECAVPQLARAIEESIPVEEIARIVREALQTRVGKKFEFVLLGCTHYPLVADVIQREVDALFGPTPLIDPAEAVAETVVEQFDVAGSGKLSFIISKDSHAFRNRIAPLFLEISSTLSVI